MAEQPTSSVPETTQELEQAIQNYRTSDRWGQEIFKLWQSIRTAALTLRAPEPNDQVPGEDSY